jgi:hypothetical protein
VRPYPSSWTEYVGNLHIHSNYSDGAGSRDDVLRSAGKAGLDFIIFNDHEHMLDSLHLDEEGEYRGVRVLRGAEIGGRYHHYLAYNVKEIIGGHLLSPQKVIDKVSGQGGFGFLAHPFEKGMPFSEKSIAYTWNDLAVHGYAGICIWNYMSRWKERIKTPFHALYCLLFKACSLKGPSRETLSFWDQVCRERRVTAIGGSDAHGSVFQWGALKFTPVTYDRLMNTINVHLLLDGKLPEDFQEAKRHIYDALREGRVFISHDGLAPGRGFRYYSLLEDGSVLTMGQEATFQPGSLFVHSPEDSRIRLLRNGSVIQTWRGKEGAYALEQEGVYRIEISLRIFPFGWRPWIFSNPIYLRKQPDSTHKT